MKRYIIALCLLTAPAALRAQTCAASPCSATPVATAARVRSAVSFGVGGGLDFGVVAGGTTAAVDAQGTSATGGVAGAVVLTANQRVTVTAVFSDLTSAGMPNLPVSSPSCGWSTATSTSVANTTIFTCGTGYASPGAGTGASGIYVWLGGSVATTTTTPAGNYAGTATVTGVYVSY
ncbi:MAG TPA: hypothetical protein VM033_07385 [Gemmatimonadaceae bacterium]|nr:hypothetical protein [Gemmatimonadaceae bacterium]